MKARSRRNIFVIGAVAAVFASQAGCATVEEPEMIPVEQVVTYSEKADYRPVATGRGYGPLAQSSAATCRKYREKFETYETFYLASVGLGAVSAIVGLITDNDTVREVAGAAAVGSTIAQAGIATGAEALVNEARERGCDLR